MSYGQWIQNALDMAGSLPFSGIVGILWFTLAFEVPRYALTYIPALLIIWRGRKAAKTALQSLGRVSVLVAGHNEADAIEKCILSLQEQTFRDFEVICVSDGSTDETFAIMARLQREGLVDKIAECQIRGGKSSAINLGMRLATGDIVVVIDCDCSFEPDAFEELLRPFSDPQVAAVSGTVLVRNGEKTITASLQAIEYMVSICLGRTALDMFGQLSIISGAFGAFRSAAFTHVGGMDPGPGEDFDLTIRLRIAGYKIRYALRSVCYTDVPVSLFNLFRQRARWERDAVWIRFRKYAWTLNPFRKDMPIKELPHQLDFLFFDVIASIIFPFFLVSVFYNFGVGYGLFMLLVLYVLTLLLDLFTFTCAVMASGRSYYWRFWPFLLIYGPFKGYIMRFARLYSCTEEWIYSASRSDNFAPPKVNAWISWK
ncbi:MAG: glycosyltransferase family 2 protein [Beijerinckiaceae bacterium]